MENNTMEFSLPQTPRGLCFDRLDFMKTNFSVDNFLADHQNVSSLESMRDDLGAYLKVLRLAMIELINKDYANFVNLSATLIGFDKSIEKIKQPLVNLNDEVATVKQYIETAMNEVSMWLNQRHSLQKKKQLLKYYSQTVNCLKILNRILNNISDKKCNEKILIADRAALEYNQVKYSIMKSDNLIKQDQKKEFEMIGESLINTLNELVFQFWNDSNEDNLLKTLTILASLNRVNETEVLIKKKALAPLLQNIINESSLQKSKTGLQGIYERILSLLNNELKIFVTVTNHSKLAFLSKKYRFLVNCFWCEVESRLETNLASIFAPGNPRIFYKRYTESMQFMKKLEEHCNNQETIALLHSTAEYKNFQKKWNLPVYFQIRFQEIAGAFEATLQKEPTENSTNTGFILKETQYCWKALEECWSDGVYIEALAHKFWKLTLQLILRYATWCEYCTQNNKSQKADTTSINKNLIISSISLYIDSQTLLQRTSDILITVEAKLPLCDKDLFKRSLKPSQDALQGTREKVIKSVVKELFDYFNIQLKQVSDIPRLYRKTNRSIPTKPCNYTEVVSQTLRDFDQDVTQRVDSGFMDQLYMALFNVMTVSYYRNVEDVLTSIQKTEESLRRLKQIRDKAEAKNSSNGGVTDGDKIRLQLKVDIVAYQNIAESLKVDVNCIDKMKELNNMILEAVKSIDIK